MKPLLAPLVALLVLVPTCRGDSMPTPSSPPTSSPASSSPAAVSDLELVAVDARPEYVLGYPVHVALVVQAPADTTYNALPFADLFDLNDAVGLQLVDSQGRSIVEHIPTPILEPEVGHYGEPLGAGEARRMLTDVSPLIPADLEPGPYELRLHYATPHKVYGPKSVPVVFRVPTPSEAAQLARLQPGRGRAANWATWTVTRPSTPVDQDPIDPANPLALNLVLRHLLFGPEELDRVDPSRLDAITGLGRPEAQAFQAELYLARGDRARYQALNTTATDFCRKFGAGSAA